MITASRQDWRVYSIFGFILTLFLAVGSYNSQNTEQYPSTEQSDHADQYFGLTIDDPYQWLEDATNPNTIAWIQAQNRFTQSHLSQIPYRDEIKQRLTELYNFERYSTPIRVGEFLIFSKNNGLQNQDVIYIQREQEEPEVLLDPNALSAAGDDSIGDMVPSNNNQFIAFAIHHAGSDFASIRIMDIRTKQMLPDVIERVKFSTISWKADGFFYGRHSETASNHETNSHRQILYHRLGTSQAHDELIFEDPAHPNWMYSTRTLEDERYLFLYRRQGAGIDIANEILFKDLADDQSSFQPLFAGFKHAYAIVEAIDDYLIVSTNAGAPNYRVVLVDIKNPSEDNWKELIPEKPEQLANIHLSGSKLLACYLKDASHVLYQYDLQGNLDKEVPLPKWCSITSIQGHPKQDDVYYSVTSFTLPKTIFKYNIPSSTNEVWKKSKANFDSDKYITHLTHYRSKDGTQIPLFITHKKDLQLDGMAPTLLFGYGGFGYFFTPIFHSSHQLLLEHNGVIAMPILRGGGEFGKSWHEAGKLLNKQNSFDDFIGAAEYLIHHRYTSPEKLSINGASNGGLLVGACMTQRPDLFKVALPAVGVLDMLRYHKFTVGYLWKTEYGCSDDEIHFYNLLKYSPLHNIQEGINYPATLIITGDHDDRVVPAHSFKFAATLQEKSAKQHPILIRIQRDVGHGAGKPMSKIIEEQTDIWSFLFYHTNSY